MPFFFSSRRRHTRFDCDWSSECALPISSCAYHAPARYDDLLRVQTRIEGATGVRIAFVYRIESEADDRLLATGTTRHASVDRNGRPRRLPARLRELLA